METYEFKVEVNLTVEAPSYEDAVEVLEDYLGDAEFGGFHVDSFNILDTPSAV